MQSYTQMVTRYREEASEIGLLKSGGLNYILRNVFSLIPASLGHIIDTLIGLDGVFAHEADGSRIRDSHLAGPFGLLFGAPFYILGAVLGHVLQMILFLPAGVFFLLDKLIGLAAKGYDKGMIGGMMDNRGYTTSLAGHIFTIIGRVTTWLTSQLPEVMHGFTGYLFGLIPHIATYIVTRMTGTICSLFRFAVDGLCLGIRALYSAIGGLFTSKKSAEAQANAANERAQAEPEQPAPQPQKRPRIRIPESKRQEEILSADQDLKEIFDKNVDLFALLEINFAEYSLDQVKAQFKKFSRVYHPDKMANETTEVAAQMADKFVRITKARDILSDEQKAKAYIRWYKIKFPNNVTQNGATLFATRQQQNEPTVAATVHAAPTPEPKQAPKTRKFKRQ